MTCIFFFFSDSNLLLLLFHNSQKRLPSLPAGMLTFKKLLLMAISILKEMALESGSSRRWKKLVGTTYIPNYLLGLHMYLGKYNIIQWCVKNFKTYGLMNLTSVLSEYAIGTSMSEKIGHFAGFNNNGLYAYWDGNSRNIDWCTTTNEKKPLLCLF